MLSAGKLQNHLALYLMNICTSYFHIFIPIYIQTRLLLSNDWLEVLDGGNQSAPSIGERMCGANIPSVIDSSSNELFVRFHSDNGASSSGYRIRVFPGNIKHLI